MSQDNNKHFDNNDFFFYFDALDFGVYELNIPMI